MQAEFSLIWSSDRLGQHVLPADAIGFHNVEHPKPLSARPVGAKLVSESTCGEFFAVC